MIKRILDRKPDHSRQTWSASWSNNLSYLNNISKYDAEWHESKVRIKSNEIQMIYSIR